MEKEKLLKEISVCLYASIVVASAGQADMAVRIYEDCVKLLKKANIEVDEQTLSNGIRALPKIVEAKVSESFDAMVEPCSYIYTLLTIANERSKKSEKTESRPKSTKPSMDIEMQGMVISKDSGEA